MPERKTSVLVIDDEEHILELVSYNLRLDGFAVETAANADEGLSKIHKTSFDVVLLDIVMPGMDGLEVLAAIKQNPKTASIKVFMLTARSMIGDIERAYEIGADDYITKPFEADQLGKILKRKLGMETKAREDADPTK